jgi:uncharacterized protein YijF (DUF1287 family)
MAYRFVLDSRNYLARSRHTSDWGLFQINQAYGYASALAYYGQKLSPSDVGDVARAAGVTPDVVIRSIEDGVRAGGMGMIPQPEFRFVSPI